MKPFNHALVSFLTLIFAFFISFDGNTAFAAQCSYNPSGARLQNTASCEIGAAPPACRVGDVSNVMSGSWIPSGSGSCSSITGWCDMTWNCSCELADGTLSSVGCYKPAGVGGGGGGQTCNCSDSDGYVCGQLYGNACGQTCTGTRNCPPAPIIDSFTAEESTNPTNKTTQANGWNIDVSLGAEALLKWESKNTTGCQIYGMSAPIGQPWNASFIWNPTAVQPNGFKPTGSLTKEQTNYTYSLSCFSNQGGSVTQTVTVSVKNKTPDPSCSITAMEAGSGKYKLDYTIRWGSYYDIPNMNMVLNPGTQMIQKTAQEQSGSVTIDAPTQTTTYVLTPFTGFSPGYADLCQTTIAVVPPPDIVFNANPQSVSSGGSSTLTWSASNATSCEHSWDTDKAASGTYPTGPLSGSKGYTISCSGAGGTANKSVTVLVTTPSSQPVCPVCPVCPSPSYKEVAP